jgi:hypothetical protein
MTDFGFIAPPPGIKKGQPEGWPVYKKVLLTTVLTFLPAVVEVRHESR